MTPPLSCTSITSWNTYKNSALKDKLSTEVDKYINCCESDRNSRPFERLLLSARSDSLEYCHITFISTKPSHIPITISTTCPLQPNVAYYCTATTSLTYNTTATNATTWALVHSHTTSCTFNYYANITSPTTTLLHSPSLRDCTRFPITFQYHHHHHHYYCITSTKPLPSQHLPVIFPHLSYLLHPMKDPNHFASTCLLVF